MRPTSNASLVLTLAGDRHGVVVRFARSGRAVGQARRANDAAIRSLENDGNVLTFGKTFANAQWRSRPVAAGPDRPNDIGFVQGANCVFTASNRGAMIVAEPEQ